MMPDGGRVLAVVPARGGSKGLPGKNTRVMAGKPLIGWTIEAAKGAAWVDAVVLSTDDAGIADVAGRFGCAVPFMRDAALATDEARTFDVVMDVVRRLPGFEWLVLLQPTSPLRTSEDIDAALALAAGSGAPCVVSVTESEELPWWMYTLRPDHGLDPLLSGTPYTRRQDAPKTYVLNGAIYAARVDWLASNGAFVGGESVGYVMPRSRSIDIDTEEDFNQASLHLE